MSEEMNTWSSRTLLGLGNLNSDVWEGNANRRDDVAFLTIADYTLSGVGAIQSSLVGTDGRDAIGDQYAVSSTTFSGVGR